MWNWTESMIHLMKETPGYQNDSISSICWYLRTKYKAIGISGMCNLIVPQTSLSDSPECKWSMSQILSSSNLPHRFSSIHYFGVEKGKCSIYKCRLICTGGNFWFGNDKVPSKSRSSQNNYHLHLHSRQIAAPKYPLMS